MIINALLTEIKIKLLQHYLLYIFFNSIQFIILMRVVIFVWVIGKF